MFLKLLRLESKSFFRSASLGKEVTVTAILWFFYAYMLVSLLVLGFALHNLLERFVPDQKPIELVNGFILIWIITEILSRFYLQDLPTMGVKPLLVQNVKRTQITHFALFRSLFSFYNLMSLVTFVPFAIVSYGKGDISASQMAAWLVCILSLVLILNYINFLVKRHYSESPAKLLPLVVVAIVLVSLEYFDVFKSTVWVAKLMAWVMQNPWACIFYTMGTVLTYIITFKALYKSLYLDSALKSKTDVAKTMDLAWVDRFGSLAHFMKLDLKMVWRNKRPKSVVILSVLFLAYGLIFYPNPAYQKMPAFLIFVGIFMTGAFMMNFGQFVPAWDSSYYGLMMSQNIKIRTYLQSKANLMYISVFLCTILTIPYVYFGWQVLFMNIAAAIFNIGVNVPVLLYGGSFNKKRVDLQKSQMMNYQGTSAAQFLVILPLMFIPIIIWGISAWLTNGYWASFVLAMVGLLGIVFREKIMGSVANAYKIRKYRALQGFKEVQQ